ncbi:hypothetical protein LTR09_012361 [Extremus antarcticus]|uniref:GH16 domain-containing protein n=1 Tax=Extremus antarcticus TaxID=702011 RepID=A0AAJ0D5C4_9PEZI|nr:hypothetical protein LTR09_012361 [Extremus antarcticus]
MSLSRLSFVFSLAISLSAALNPILPEHCPCGYVDHTYDRLFTDAIIVYFNETQTIDPHLFVTQSFEDKKEKGWESIFRRGASPSNVGVGDTSNLQLFVDRYTPNHLVNGSGLRTVRQDIQYGSFRASMRSPSRGVGGSALSLVLKYNASESLELDTLNMDSPQLARLTNLVNGELPVEDNTVSYTALKAGLGSAPSVDLWDFVDYRMDWTDYDVAFWANTILTRQVGPSNRTLPGLPQPFYLSHWSTGDSSYMQGPPAVRSEANVAWIRTFFNSSLMTAQEHQDFDSRCQQWMACSMEDARLRGSTPYGQQATVRFERPPRNQQLRIPAAWLAGICSCFGVFVLANSCVRTVPSALQKAGRVVQRNKTSKLDATPSHPHSAPPPSRPSYESERGLVDPAEPDEMITQSIVPYTGQSTPYFLEPYTPGSGTPWRRSDLTLTSNNFSGMTDARSRPVSIAPLYLDFKSQIWNTSNSRLSALGHGEAATNKGEVEAVATISEMITGDEIMPVDPGFGTVRTADVGELCPVNEKVKLWRNGKDMVVQSSEERPPGDDMGTLTTLPPVLEGLAMPLRSQRKTDYLAGLVALACVSISFRYFLLTFWPFVAMGFGNPKHYPWENWAYIFIGGYFSTPLWFGPFFITSSRFLSARYLQEGDLADVAKNMLLRGPRLIIPVAIVAILEYFFISLGLTDNLDWLPSISWSTWPFVMPQGNFGSFVNNIIELAYFIPNGAPDIVNYYCAGVLWTIPVQLQLSYIVLLAVVMIRQMKTAWKRCGYYTCCVILGWYARSWSACFWMGLLLTDLDITHDWNEWARSRPRVLYPVLAAATVVAIGSPLLLVFDIPSWFMINENDIHPDVLSGLPLGNTPGGGYPAYYEPSLAILLFSTSIQIIADLSTWVQKFLSIRPLRWMRPHIMTVYLVHGFIFWSLGSWLCIILSMTEVVPYWANLLITLLCCYGVIAIVAVLLTPLVEFTTRSCIKNIWRWASEEPVPKIPTTGKFGKALILDRSSTVEPAREA